MTNKGAVDMIIDIEKIKKAIFEGTRTEASERTGLSLRTIDGYRSKESSKSYRDWQGISLKTALEIIKKLEEREMLKEELQEVLDFIEDDFGVLLNDSKINDSQVSEFETNGKIKFECYHDKNKYAIVSKDEIELDGFKDHYQTGEFEVYYFGA